MPEMFDQLEFRIIFFGVAGALGVLFLLVAGLLFDAGRSRRSVASAVKRIRSLNALLAVEDLPALDEIMSSVPGLEEQWMEFKEGLVQFPAGLISLRWSTDQLQLAIGGVPTELSEQPTGLHNSLPISDFFTDDHYLHSIHFVRFTFPALHNMPVIATSLGVLGTFAGVTVGLMGLDVSAVAESTRTVQLLVSSLGAAFWTSILGVLASLVINILVSWQESANLRQLGHLREAIERKVPRVTPEKMLMANAHYAQRQVEHLNQIRKESAESRASLQVMVDELVDKLSARFDSSISTVLGPQIEELVGLVQNKMSDVAENSSEQAREFTDQMVQRLTGTLEESFSGMGSHVENMGTQMREVTDSLQAVVVRAEETTAAQRGVFQEAAVALADAESRSRDASTRVAEGQELAARLSQLAEALTVQQQRASELTSQQATLQSTAHGHLENVSESVGQATQAYTQAAVQFQTTVGALGKATHLLSDRVGGLASSTEKAATATKTSADSLVARTKEEQKLLDGFRGVAGALEAAASTTSTTNESLTEAAQAVAAREQQIERTAKTLSRLAGELHESSEESHKRLQEVSAALEGGARDMQQAVSATEDWNRAATSAVTQFGDSVRTVIEHSLTQYDSSLSQAVGSLATSIRELDDVAEELADSATRRQGRPT